VTVVTLASWSSIELCINNLLFYVHATILDLYFRTSQILILHVRCTCTFTSHYKKGKPLRRNFLVWYEARTHATKIYSASVNILSKYNQV
jgi:hypothetical protein